MAITAGELLQRRRVARKMTKTQVAAACHCSVDVIDRLESGETKEPHPDLIDMYGDAIGDPGLWPEWMSMQFASYNRHHGPPSDYGITGALLAMEAELTDLMDQEKLQALRKDLADGKLDNEALRLWVMREGREAVAAIDRMLELVSRQMKGGV